MYAICKTNVYVANIVNVYFVTMQSNVDCFVTDVDNYVDYDIDDVDGNVAGGVRRKPN